MSTVHLTRFALARMRQLEVCSPTELLQEARLPQQLLEQERITLTMAQWFALWEAFERVCDDPAFGLELSRLHGTLPLDPLMITALSARDFREALGKVERYKQLHSFEKITVSEGEGRGLWQITTEWPGGEGVLPRLLSDVTFSCFQEIVQRGTGRKIYPKMVCFQRDESYRALYEERFCCPVRFGSERDRVVYDEEAMTLPFLSANPELLAMLEPAMERELEATRSDDESWSWRVERLVRGRLAGGGLPSMAELSRELHVSARTLQRRLAEEGRAYQEVLEEVRGKLARHYLSEATMELDEIAFLLGYQEASSFHRAFQRWEGMTPGQWRAREGSVE